jgi:predicted metal-dependent phosphoesterase TrpH
VDGTISPMSPALPIHIDLHTHSIASSDGALREAHYARMLDSGRLHCIAITDHNTIAFAQKLHKKFGAQIIVGEEITTRDGELIGLFLKEAVPAGLSARQTVQAIREQQGLVYVPHPFETVRKGITLETLTAIADDVDIIETNNGRAVFQNKARDTQNWAVRHRVSGAASSDAHGWHGWGKTYSRVAVLPTRDTLVELLAEARYQVGSPGLRGVLYPKVNRLRKRLQND